LCDLNIKGALVKPEQVFAAENYRSYLSESRKFFEKHSEGMVSQNHYQHNLEPSFWTNMVSPVMQKPELFEGELGFEYGCGAGRNLVNLSVAGPFKRVDGIDISKSNAISSQSFVDGKVGLGRSICLEGNGYSCLPFPDNTYMWVISHQVFIHIPNRNIRQSILLDFHRILKPGGSAVVHFKTMTSSVPYEANFNKFPMNVTVENSDMDFIRQDFLGAGFTSVSIQVGENYYDGKLEIYVTASKG
jgi:SAM-dependent methyltransferase